MASFNCGKGQPYTVGQGIYEESETQKLTIGMRMALGDGRVFHYAKFGGTLTAGQVAIAAAHTAAHHCLVTALNPIGTRTYTVTLATTAATANMYKDGTLMVIAGTGIGQTYKIKSNPAQATVTGTLALELYDQLVIATAAADSKTDLVPNLFNGVTQDANEERLHLGAPLIAGTSGYFGWLQTWGLCAVLAGDTAAAGTVLNADANAGETKTMNQYTMDLIGAAYGEAHADGEYNATFLRLVP